MFNILKYIGYRLYSVLSRALPLWLAYRLADLVGYAVYKSGHEGNKKRAEIIYRMGFHSAGQMVRKNIQLFNRDLVDFFRGNMDRFVKIEGLELLDDALARGKGVILASAHMGSWEMAGSVLSLRGYPIYGMVWEARNRYVADMFSRIRSKMGVGAVEKRSLRHVLELLQKNKIIGIMLDVPGGIKGISYSLCGYNVRLPRGPAAISLETGAELLTVTMMRDRGLFIEKPKLGKTEEEMTINLFENIKKYIEKDPTQWHWIKYFFET